MMRKWKTCEYLEVVLIWHEDLLFEMELELKRSEVEITLLVEGVSLCNGKTGKNDGTCSPDLHLTQLHHLVIAA
jgi:hypothetical protein